MSIGVSKPKSAAAATGEQNVAEQTLRGPDLAPAQNSADSGPAKLESPTSDKTGPALKKTGPSPDKTAVSTLDKTAGPAPALEQPAQTAQVVGGIPTPPTSP